MAANDWKSRLGVVFSTNPEFNYQHETEEPQQTVAPAAQKLVVRIDRHARGGKQVTLIDGFTGRTEDLDALARKLKTQLGVGGSAKDGQIVIQGDFRDRVTDILLKDGYNAKRGN